MKKITRLILLLFVFLSAYSNHANASIWYVNANASGSNNGKNWTNAYNDLQLAISSSTSGDTIWVAAGTYKPTTGTSRTVYFTLKSGVHVFGGFAGNESRLEQRDFKNNTTILSGDIGNAGSTSDNTYHVVYGFSISTTATLDGFRITAGYAGSGGDGGGLYVDGCKVNVANCHFTSNTAGSGGAIYQEGGKMLIENCMFNDNAASSDIGAAIYARISGSSTIRNCQFMNNQVDKSGSGGIVYFSSFNDVYISHCIFSGNNCDNGGVIKTGTVSTFTLKNSLIVGNYGIEGIPISIVTLSSSLINILNCTVAHNYSDTNFTSKINSPVIYMPNSAKARNVINCIIQGNTGSTDVSAGCNVMNCILSKTYTNGKNNSIQSAQFVKPGKMMDAPFSHSGFDYSLQFNSPAIDMGDKTYLSNEDSLDLANKPRIIGNLVDAGCFENQYCELKPKIQITGSREICPRKFATFTADIGNKWVWSNGAKTRSIQISTAGKYSVIAFDTVKGCRGNVLDSVKVLTASVKISGVNRFCDGASSKLTATGSNVNYLWNTSDTTQSIVVTKKGRYKVTAISNNACLSYDSLLVSVDTLPNPKIVVTESSGLKSNDTIICSGADITLLATGGFKYTWSDSLITSQLKLKPTSDQKFAVKASNSFGCYRWSVPIQIKVNLLPVPTILVNENSGKTPNDGVICAGDTALLQSGNYVNNLWSTGVNQKSIKVTPSVNTDYRLTVLDSNGCSASTVKNIASVALPKPTITMVNQKLETGTYASFQWYLNDTLINGAASNIITPLKNGKYKVEVVNIYGCKGVSTIFNLTNLRSEKHILKTITVNPNPASDHFYLSDIGVWTELKIYSVTGCLLGSYTINKSDMEVNVSQLDTGLYFLTLSEENGRISGTAKLFINR